MRSTRKLRRTGRRTLPAEEVVYYLALVRVTPLREGLLVRWLPLLPITGPIQRLTALLAALLDRGIVDGVKAVGEVVRAMWACGEVYFGYHRQKIARTRPIQALYRLKVWGLVALALFEAVIWAIQSQPVRA